MKPARLSASSIAVYEQCPAHFKVDYIDKRAQDAPNLPAMNGTAIHAALEWFVQEMRHGNGLHTLDELHQQYEHEYWHLMPNGSFLSDGKEMLQNWHDRSGPDFWANRTVLCCETRETFPLVMPDGSSIPVVYVWDRGDSLDGGDTIEITDYKSVRGYVSNDELDHKVQPKLYALAAKLKYPKAKKIKFTMELLRFTPIGRTYDAEELREFYVYLRHMYTRMLADDGTKETVNGECQYCVRRPSCKALRAHTNAGGIMSLTDIEDIADQRRVIADQLKGLEVLKKDLDERILSHCERDDLREFDTSETLVRISAKSTTDIDSERVRALVGDKVAADLGWPGKIGQRKFAAYCGNPSVDPGIRSALRSLVRKSYGNPYVKTTRKLKSDQGVKNAGVSS